MLSNFRGFFKLISAYFAQTFEPEMLEHSPQHLSRNLVVCFLEVDEKCVDVFGKLPRFLENLLKSENMFCSVTNFFLVYSYSPIV